jgi:GTP cyclohydrolase I
MQRAVQAFLDGLAEGREIPGLERTPERVARAWAEDLVSGYAVDPLQELSWTEAPAHAGPVLVRSVDFASVCLHHLLPFFGRAHIAYLPGERLAGLSKIGRVVDAHARRLQTQEQLTRDIVETLRSGLEPRGVLAVLEAEHTCMTLRGVRKERSSLWTMAAAGVYETDAVERGQILAVLAPGRRG